MIYRTKFFREEISYGYFERKKQRARTEANHYA